MKKILSAIVVALVLVVSFTGCEKYLDVNNNVDAPDYVEANLYLPGILSSIQGCYWDIRALGPLTQMMGTSSYTNFANNYYTASSDAGGEMWRMAYWLQGMNLENMVNQAIADEAWTLAGIGYAIKAFSWDCLTKYHGDLPMKQAYEPGRLSHDYDYQKDIMPQVREWAQTAIEYLEKEDNFEYGTTLTQGDIVYHGDRNKWLKFAHAVIVSDLAALSNKSDFVQNYADQLIQHAQLAISENSENFAVERMTASSTDPQFSAYYNFWGTYRGNLTNVYWQSDYIVQIMTGSVPQYDKSTGDKVDDLDGAGEPVNPHYPWKPAENQIICDTTKVAGHYDPRVAAKLSSVDYATYDKMDDLDAIKSWHYNGSGFTGASGPIGTAPNLYGFRAATPSTAVEGHGRWLFRDDAPYVVMTAAEIQFELAEAYWKKGDKAKALAAFKKGVALDEEFTLNYLNPGSLKEDGGEAVVGGGLPGGSGLSKAAFKTLSEEYLAGPYVAGITESTLTLSHIMMQKYVALWPWGALEAWTDLRKYHFDIQYTGDYPKLNNGWTQTIVDSKFDDDPTKVYKGFYLAPADVEGRRGTYNAKNVGSPCYRVRPRYNSEYMWNKGSLEALVPISGTADNYHCSIPWFAFPGEVPSSL